MDVILTHEQADFDAIGAALGAYLMNEQAHAVLPRRMNRNVRAFLTLYGAELPFVEARDLPGETIETLTLVDTQSMVTLKGMTRHTKIQVVDHHSARPEQPESWSVTLEPVGACTTLFVEGLHEHNGALTPVHATLMLLGIYEDTGSLTYTSTTPRDIRAAAFLLEQGANLQVVSSYLNPPLSDEQRQVYDRLLTTADRHMIHGVDILVARTDAEEMADEISTIAHKLRDLLDPDALILLVGTSEGIRLVARSTTDQVNVSKIAEHFGGGGHGRAAAALIHQTETTTGPGTPTRTPTLNDIHAELLKILPDVIRPTLTVRQIMSPKPLVLDPSTPAERAAQLMQRYGYEGYPVVKEGKVQGLLTRRAVDRAISHKLNHLPTASLMESGEVTVNPEDSIEHLRRVMIDSGWGQIPVVDPKSGNIIGIATRTDLLKTMMDASSIQEQQNLASRLEAALSPGRLALLKTIAAQGHEQHMAVFVVGGFVRDLLLSRPSQDFDLVVEGDAISLANALVACYGGRLITHGRFGTAKWNIADIRSLLAQGLSDDGQVLDPDNFPENLDIISARTEFYDYPTALPTVERSSIKLDLHRRDFTINTMALRLDGRHYGELYDYWGGLRDLKRGLVRVLHSLSFVDDPTRAMRAVRFEQRFGFQIETRTLQLIQEARPLFRQVSGDRLRHELVLILSEERAMAMLARLRDLGLLNAIHPALTWSDADAPFVERALNEKIPPGLELPEKLGSLSLRAGLAILAWLMQYTVDDALSIAHRLRLPNEITGSLTAAKDLQTRLPEMTSALPSQITTLLDQVPAPAIYMIYLFDPQPPVKQILDQYLRVWQNISPATRGNELLQLGLKPGPRYREILNSLRDAWLNGEIHSVEDEKALLQKLIDETSGIRSG